MDRKRPLWDVITQAFFFCTGLVCFVGGVLLTGVLAYTQRRYGDSSLGVVAIIVMVALVYVLHYAEGTEVAVTTILDRKEDQIPAEHRASVEKLRARVDDFVAGRQLLVALMVLALGLMCELLQLSCHELRKDRAIAAQMSPSLLELLTYSPMKSYGYLAYAYFFPVFTVLLWSQLYSKFVIHLRPLKFFADWRTQSVIWLSVPVGGWVRWGLPKWLINWTVGNVKEPEVGPSRLEFYNAGATFNAGFGYEKVRIDLTIDPNDGSMRVEKTIDVRVFARRVRQWTLEEASEEPIVSAIAVHVPDIPLDGHRFWQSSTVFGEGAKTAASTFEFASALATDTVFTFTTGYNVGSTASHVPSEDPYVFSFNGAQCPIKLLLVTVNLKGGERAQVDFFGPDISVKTLFDYPLMNHDEAQRHEKRTILLPKGGVSFTVEYPLSAKYEFRWTLRNKV